MSLPPLSPLLAEFRLYLVAERNLSPHTVRNYLLDLIVFERELQGKGRELLDADPADIDEHLAHLAQKLAPASQARHVTALKAFYRFLVHEGLLPNSPARWAKRPVVPVPNRPTLSVAEVFAVLARPPTDSALGLRDRAMLELLYGAGLRASELAGLDDLHVDVKGRTLRVRGKGGHERICPVNRLALNALEAYLERRGELRQRGVDPEARALFLGVRGTRLTPKAIHTRVRKVAAACGTKLTPHGLRRAYATHLFERGARSQDIQELLGHSFLETTQRYIHVSAEVLRRQYEAAHPRARLEEGTRSSAAPAGAPRKPSARSRNNALTHGPHMGSPTRRLHSEKHAALRSRPRVGSTPRAVPAEFSG
jgi:integrase/recombinase XerC